MTKNEREIGGVESSTCYLPVRYRQPWLWNEYCNKGRRAGGEMLAAAGCWLTALRVVFPTPMNRNSLLASTKILIQIFGGADISYDGIQYCRPTCNRHITSNAWDSIHSILLISCLAEYISVLLHQYLDVTKQFSYFVLDVVASPPAAATFSSPESVESLGCYHVIMAKECSFIADKCQRNVALNRVASRANSKRQTSAKPLQVYMYI